MTVSLVRVLAILLILSGRSCFLVLLLLFLKTSRVITGDANMGRALLTCSVGH